MTDSKKPTELVDEALEGATGGFYSMAGSGTELARKRKGDSLIAFGNDTTTVVEDASQDGNLIAFGNDSST